MTRDSLLAVIVRLSTTHRRLHAWHHRHTHLGHIHHHRIHLAHLRHTWHLTHRWHSWHLRHLWWPISTRCTCARSSLIWTLKHHLLSIDLLLKHRNLLVLPQHDGVMHHLLLLWGHRVHLLLSLSCVWHIRHTGHLHTTWSTHHTCHWESHASHIWHTKRRLLSCLIRSLTITSLRLIRFIIV